MGNVGDSNDGIFTDRPGQVTNDFFAYLIDMDTVWEPNDESEERFEGRNRTTGEKKWPNSRPW